MPIIFRHGDLLAQKDIQVIVHGCNCFNTMGAGIALQIRKKYPAAYKEDCTTIAGDRHKLGKITFVETDGKTIVNAYTQYEYSRRSIQLDYLALAKCCQKISKRFKGKRIGMPRIGCGLAGGEWTKVLDIITRFLGDKDVVICSLS